MLKSIKTRVRYKGTRFKRKEPKIYVCGISLEKDVSKKIIVIVIEQRFLCIVIPLFIKDL